MAPTSFENRYGAEILTGAAPMSDAEKYVLEVFRRYRVAPGKMLCFYGQDLEKLHQPLAQLTKKRLLVAESFRGAYSLTEAGFSAMQDGACGEPEARPPRGRRKR